MTAESIARVLLRDLSALRSELRAYPDASRIWVVPPGITNSAGTLALHLVGNLQHFIGAQLGDTGYVRDRDAEFSDRNVPLEQIEARISRTSEVVRATLAGLGEDDLARRYPIEILGTKLPTGLFLTHLAAHFAYHLGQIDYHRRLVSGVDEPAGAQSIAGLLGGD